MNYEHIRREDAEIFAAMEQEGRGIAVFTEGSATI